jgi:cysteine desulfurase / selenocysteine lyase
MGVFDSIFGFCNARRDAASRIRINSVRKHIVGLDRRVPVHNNRLTHYINLDNAATTPPLKTVMECHRRFFELYSSVHRGSGFKSLVSTHVYERCRKVVADFIGADPFYHSIIFTHNATHSLNKLARKLCPAPDKVVITTEIEHHSNMLPWRKLGCKVEYARIRPEDGLLDMVDMEEKVRRNAGKLALVAVSGASNVTGVMPPVRQVARLAHENGALLAVDATQLVPHRPFSMGDPEAPDRIDFAVFSGHKMYAPFGAGVLAGPKSFFDHGEPDEVGGGTIVAVGMDDVVWAHTPEKDEAGTPNVPGAVALASAMTALQAIGMDNVAEHERELSRRLLAKLARMDGLTLYGPVDPEVREDRLGVITFNADRYNHCQLASYLGHEWAIGVRNGCFCAQIYVRRLLNVPDSQTAEIARRLTEGDPTDVPGMVRVSFGMYNTVEEVDAFAEALQSILSDGPKASYDLDRQSKDLIPHSFANLDEYLPF